MQFLNDFDFIKIHRFTSIPVTFVQLGVLNYLFTNNINKNNK